MNDQSTPGSEQTQVGHCKQDPTDMYVGRGPDGLHMVAAETGERGWLGNPYPLEKNSRERSIRLFREAFEERLERDDEFRKAVAELAGQTLGCWCQRLEEDEPACHAEIIAEWADRLAKTEEVVALD